MAESMGFRFVYAFFGFASGTLFFISTAIAAAVGFSVCLFLSIFKRGYGLKKRLWFLILLFILCALLRVRSVVTGERDLSPFLFLMGLTLFLPVYFIREKPPKTKENTEHAREYVRLLEDKMKRAADFENSPCVKRERPADIKTEILKAEPEKPSVNDKPDFSHVKNVLQRLEPASLSYADRRQIHELELSIYEAENGGYSEETRRKVNEGLGYLLKIMARHGV